MELQKPKKQPEEDKQGQIKEQKTINDSSRECEPRESRMIIRIGNPGDSTR